MEAGMERWGIEVPSGDDEEQQKTELALAFDDAEFSDSAPESASPSPAQPPQPEALEAQA
jgi:hypothetical protein